MKWLIGCTIVLLAGLIAPAQGLIHGQHKAKDTTRFLAKAQTTFQSLWLPDDTRDFDDRVWAVQHAKNLPPWERDRMLRKLSQERQERRSPLALPFRPAKRPQ